MLEDYHNKLKYRIPAEKWIEGLPLGDGSTGAMLYGEPGREVLALNHDTLYRNNISKNVITSGIIPEIRKLCLEGKAQEAEEMFLNATKDGPDDVNSYQPLGDLYVRMHGLDSGSFDEYERELDLENGLLHINYVLQGTRYTYECFVSEFYGILLLKISSDILPFICEFELSRTDDPECSIMTYYDEFLTLKGEFIEGVTFAAVADVAVEFEKKHIIGSKMIVDNTHQVILKLALSTSYKSTDTERDCKDRLQIIKDDYETIKSLHIKNHRELYNRVRLSLGSADNEKSTEQLFDRVISCKEIDAPVYEQLFNVARYLMISSSRPGSLPINLQGIWNDKIKPAFECGYTTDMNIQMHYWLALPCNLFECEKPVFDMIWSNIEKLKSLAKNIFGCNGVFIPQYTDFKFEPTKGQYGAFQLLWSGAAAWMAQHFYEYWRYSGDNEFLFDFAYPYMKECANFYRDFLVKNEEGKYIICPSCSPENKTIKDTWVVNSATMDITLVNELFGNLIRISNNYGLDEHNIEVWEEIKNNLIQYPIDKHGCLREWVEDLEELDPYHRHFSHIYGLYPGKLFTSDTTPELYNAAIKALYKRMGGDFGSAAAWSHSWYACCYARIGDGDMALNCINILISGCMENNYLTTMEDFRGHGTTARFIGFDEQLFQMDAIMGATSAIAEMLIQSFDSGIKILPALPSSWTSGKVEGLRGYDGFEFDIAWSNCKIDEIKVKSHNGGLCRLKLCRPFSGANIKCKGTTVEDLNIEADEISIKTEKECVYTITEE